MTTLLIVSHTPHYKRMGQVVGWGPTVREIDQLANLFEKIIHLAVLYHGDAPASSLSYQSQNVEFIPVIPSGGDSLIEKLGVLCASR